MARSSVANKIIDAETRSELWFMDRKKLSESQVLLLLQIYLRLGRKFPEPGQVCKVETSELGYGAASPQPKSRRAQS